MGYKDCEGFAGNRWLAVTELRGYIDLHGDLGDLLKPVFCGQTGDMRCTAGDHGNALYLAEIHARARQQDLARAAEVVGEGGIDHRRLFRNLFGHEMLVPGLVDAGGIDLDLLDLPSDGVSVSVSDCKAVSGHNGAIAILQIGDPVRHRRKGNRVRAHEHLPFAVPNRQWGARAGGDQQIRIAFKQKCQRIGSLELAQRGFDRLNGAKACVELHLRQECDGLAVGFGLNREAGRFNLCAQRAKVLDDAVVNHAHIAGLVRMCIGLRRGTVSGPAGVPDARFSRQRFMHQQIRQVHQLAHCAAPIQTAVLHRGNARAVIAAIFKPFERLDQDWCCFVMA